MKISFLLSILFIANFICTFAQVRSVSIGTSSTPATSEISIKLIKRIQNYNPSLNQNGNIYDTHIESPKSVNILKNKFYIQSLEGHETVVYNLDSMKQLKIIRHHFDKANQFLFKDTFFFDYKFKTISKDYNQFNGKPVESCFSHNGKYLWVTYYRRSYDLNAIDPSAVCIIDTEKDSIVRVMPTAPLPKMIRCSPDNKIIAVTHWGDNTVGLIDISSDNPADFHYIKNLIIDYRPTLNYNQNVSINRDKDCGHCLRGTVFTPDSKYLLIGKMGGSSIATIDVASRKYLGSVSGMMTNMRHLIISNDQLFLSINKSGFVQRTNLTDFIKQINLTKKQNNWTNTYVGSGARTIVMSPDGKYLFAAINNESKISIVRVSDMKMIAQCYADSYPVGMDISADGKYLIVTSQGKASGGGNSVMIYEIIR